MNEIELLNKKLQREKAARKQAENILEAKALELYQANESLRKLNQNLEKEIVKRTESLTQSEKRYRILVENAKDIIYNIDNEGYFLFVNSTGIQRFGYEENEILGRRYIEFMPEEDIKSEFEYYTNVKENGLISDYHEFRVVSKDGSIFWIGQNVNRVTKEDGTFYFSAVARDITRRKNTEQALSIAKQELVKSEVKYRSVIENMELGLLEVDTEGTILRVYDRFNEMVGYTEDELVGKSSVDTLLVHGFNDIIREQGKNRLDGQSGVYEIKLRRKDNTEIWVLVSGAPFYDEHGTMIGSIAVHYDITDRKELEHDLEIARRKAVKAQQAEKAFLANMSHEIRTPLNAIIGMSHLLGYTKLDEEQKDYLSALTSSTHILKSLISDILDISKIDAGSLEVQNKSFSLEIVLKQLINTFQLMNQEAEVSYTLQIDPQIDFFISSDPQLLNQILLNLLGNAQKFTSSGEIKLIVSLENQIDDQVSLLFAVSDTGIGVSEADVELIFQEFKQANSEIREKYGGTGLGLSISNQLVKLLGSKLKVKSELNKGSTFSFELEVKKLGDYVEIEDNDISTFKIENNHNHILIVEDNAMNLKYITSLLEKWKITYDVSHNGLDATKKVLSNQYDLIFMDLQMPIMDGFEATQIIRDGIHENSNIPIIALTASTFLSKKKLALKAGMTDFLSKPFTPNQLMDLVTKYLDKNIVEGQEKISFDFSKKLDYQYLRKAYADDLDYALDMFETFMDILDEEMITIRTVIDSDNIDDIKKALHRIKPTFTMVGLGMISQDIEATERKIANHIPIEIAEWYSNFEQTIQKYVPIINKEIQKLTTCLKN